MQGFSLRIALSLGLALALIACGEQPAAPSVVTTPAGLTQISIEVEGMTCEGCASSIKTAVGELPGVKNCEVQFDAGKVQVQFDPAQVDGPKIFEAIASQGYKPVGKI